MSAGFLDIYQEPLFYWFVIGTGVVSLVSFLLFAFPLTWVAWRDPPSLRAHRVQSRPMNIPKWFWPAFGRTVLNNIIATGVFTLSWPLMRQSGVHLGPWPAWYVMVAQVIFFFLLDDFLFYWAHRALHTRWLFRYVHSVHHRLRTPSAIAAHYFHWSEYLLISGIAMLGPLLIGAHVVTIWIWVAIRQLEAAMGHSGYEWRFDPLRLVPFYEGVAYHDYHHGSFVGNYAGVLGYLDRLFGTRAPGYDEYRRTRRNSGQLVVR
jgi:4-alpha-methyl-delta7-sterol-4alpha-methyl oxidase